MLKASGGFFRRFANDRRGNFAMIFALLATPVMLTVTLAVDYSNLLKVRSQTMHAADAALMAASVAVRDRTNWQDPQGQHDWNKLNRVLNQEFDSFFAANLKETNSNSILGYSSGFNQQAQTFKARIDFNYKLALLSNVFPEGIDFSEETEVLIDVEEGTALSIALVLDDSGSMGSGGKYIAMRNAVNDMVAEFNTLDPESDNIRIGAATFSEHMQRNRAMTWDRGVISGFVQHELYTSGRTRPTNSVVWATAELVDAEEERLHLDASGYAPARVMVILTDGAINPSSDTGMFLQSCMDARNAGITIYSIGFAMRNSDEQILKNCSGSSSNHYSAATAQQLTNAFKDIAVKSTMITRFVK